MRELLLFVLVVAVLVVTTALAALSGVSVSNSVSSRWSLEKNNSERAARPDASQRQRSADGALPPARPAPLAPRGPDRRRRGDDAEDAPRFGLRVGAHFARSRDGDRQPLANALERERLEMQFIPIQQMVNSISNVFQKMLIEDTPDIVPMDAERNLKKRDLGVDAEPDIFQLGVFDGRDSPLGNEDSLSFINALERFPRKPSIIEVPVFSPELTYIRRDPFEQIERRDTSNLDTSNNIEKKETDSVVSSNETEWEHDTSKDEVTNSSLVDISQEGDTVPPEEYKNKSFADLAPPEIPNEDGETAQQEMLKADTEPETPELLSEGRGTPVPALLREEILKEEGDPDGRAEADGHLAFVGHGVLLRVASGETLTAGGRGERHAVAGGRQGDGSATAVTGKTQTAEMRAARSRLHVALCALGVVAVALLVAATPMVQRVVVTMWYPRSRDVARSGDDGEGDDSGGADDDEMLVPSGKTKKGWKHGGGGVWAQWRRASGVEAVAAAAGPHRAPPRVMLSRLRAALLAAARARFPHGPRCHVVRVAAAAPRLAPRPAPAPDPAPASLVIGGGVYV